MIIYIGLLGTLPHLIGTDLQRFSHLGIGFGILVYWKLDQIFGEEKATPKQKTQWLACLLWGVLLAIPVTIIDIMFPKPGNLEFFIGVVLLLVYAIVLAALCGVWCKRKVEELEE